MKRENDMPEQSQAGKVTTAKPSDSAMTSKWSCVRRDLISFKDGPWRWAAGIQVVFANALPMAIFSLSGHLSLGLVSSLGAFTALYGTTMPLRDRLRVLPFIASAFVTASVLGVLCAKNAGLTIACMIVVAVVASILAFGAGLGPPGPMQFVLVAGVSARLADPVRLAGAPINPRLIPVLVAVGALSAYIIVAVPIVVPFVRNYIGNASAPGTLFSRSRFDAENSMITVRVALAVAAAASVGVFFRAGHGYWVVMVAGAVLQATHVSRDSAIRALQRVVGTIIGVFVFGLIRFADPRGAWLIAIEVVVARHYALALAFITPTALTIAAAGTSAPGALVHERIVDTVLGAVIAITVLWTTDWIWKRDRPEDVGDEAPS